MTIQRMPRGDGISFVLDYEDFKKSDWRTFLGRVKQIPGWEYDGEWKVWTIPEAGVDEFCRLKREIYDSVVHRDQLDLF